MAAHSSILACRILWTEEPGGLPSKGSQREKRLSTTQRPPLPSWRKSKLTSSSTSETWPGPVLRPRAVFPHRLLVGSGINKLLVVLQTPHVIIPQGPGSSFWVPRHHLLSKISPSRTAQVSCPHRALPGCTLHLGLNSLPPTCIYHGTPHIIMTRSAQVQITEVPRGTDCVRISGIQHYVCALVRRDACICTRMRAHTHTHTHGDSKLLSSSLRVPV